MGRGFLGAWRSGESRWEDAVQEPALWATVGRGRDPASMVVRAWC